MENILKKFLTLYDEHNNKNKKRLFRKKCNKYSIDNNKRLTKTIKLSNIFKENNNIDEYIIILPKLINKVFEYYHYKSGHKRYFYLTKQIISAGYYINDIYRLSEKFIDNCVICNQNKKIYLKNQQSFK